VNGYYSAGIYNECIFPEPKWVCKDFLSGLESGPIGGCVLVQNANQNAKLAEMWMTRLDLGVRTVSSMNPQTF
jgi:hypothetical protein